MCLKTLLYTKFFGTLVGIDRLDNKYYESKHRRFFNQTNRWVVYNKHNKLVANIDTVWYKWLHYMAEQPPMKVIKSYNWIIDSGMTEYNKHNIKEVEVIHNENYSVWNHKSTN